MRFIHQSCCLCPKAAAAAVIDQVFNWKVLESTHSHFRWLGGGLVAQEYCRLFFLIFKLYTFSKVFIALHAVYSHLIGMVGSGG